MTTAAAAPRPRLLVLYGSQTGTAQDVAEGLARAGAQRLFRVSLECMSEWSVERLASQYSAQSSSSSNANNDTLVLFVVSTTGDGEIPDNAKPLWRSLLRRDLPRDALSSLTFAVFGLGDSSYAKFNAAARKLWTRLTQLGALPVYDRGLGDEQSPLGLTGDLDIWSKGLWTALEARHPLPDGVPPPKLGPQLIRSRYAVRRLPPSLRGGKSSFSAAYNPRDFPLWPEAPVPGAYSHGTDARKLPPVAAGDNSATANTLQGATLLPGGFSSGDPLPFAAVVVSNDRLTSDGWSQDVRHIDVSIANSAIRYYRPGDVAIVYPRNSAVGDGSRHHKSNDITATDSDGGLDDRFLHKIAARLGVDLNDTIEISVRVPSASSGYSALSASVDAAASAPIVSAAANTTVRVINVSSVDDDADDGAIPVVYSARNKLPFSKASSDAAVATTSSGLVQVLSGINDIDLDGAAADDSSADV